MEIDLELKNAINELVNNVLTDSHGIKGETLDSLFRLLKLIGDEKNLIDKVIKTGCTHEIRYGPYKI